MKTIGMVGAVAIFACAALGCAGNPYVTSVEPNDVQATDSRSVGGRDVRAGTAFVATTDVALDTLGEPNGMPFTARVTSALVASDGSVVVAPNAILRGTLVSVGEPSAPRLRIDFQTIDTIRGQSRVHAAIVRADVETYDGPSLLEPSMMPVFQDGYIYSCDFEQYGLAETPRSGRSRNADGYELVTPHEVYIPRFAKLELVLTRALALPGTSAPDEH